MNTLSIATTLLVCLSPSAPAQESPAAGAAKLELARVDVALPESAVAERGRLSVPIVRARPDSKRIEVDVWRFRALPGAPQGAPPIFQLMGGPGWPGLEPSGIDWENGIEPFVRVADLVIVGQRGIGSSTDTGCEQLPTELERPGPRAALEERARYLRARCGECRAHWEAQGFDLSGLNVREAAADVDDVRRLLGYGKIALWGNSFGSHWSMAVMRYHPESVARAVLAGMEGPDHTYDMPSGVLRALERMAKAAESSPAFAGRVPDGGLLSAFAAMAESLDAEPFEVEVAHPRTGAATSVPFDGAAVRDLALGYSERASSRGGIATWPADVLALVEGDFERAALARLSDGDGLDLPTASFFQLDCGSGISAKRLEELRRDPAAKVVGDLGWFYEVTCPAWGSDLGDAFRTGFLTKVPTVIVHGTWDVSTPFDNALELLPCFENARFVPVEGGSHGALNEALRLVPGFREQLMRFVATGEAEPLPGELALPAVQWAAPR